MANECFKLQLTNSIGNNTFRRLNEFGIPLIKRGDGSAPIKFNFTGNGTISYIRLANGNGMLYSDNAMTQPLGTETSITSNSVYIKLNADDTVFLKGQSDIAYFQPTYESDNINSPCLSIDFSIFKYMPKLSSLTIYTMGGNGMPEMTNIEELSLLPSLTRLVVSYSTPGGNLSLLKSATLETFEGLNSFFTGDINNIAINNPKLTRLQIGCGNFDGIQLDVKNIAGTQLTDCSIQNLEQRGVITYTGSDSVSFNGIKNLVVTGNSFPTNQLDNLLIALSKSTFGDIPTKCNVTLRGTRSTISDSAVELLKTKCTLKLNNIVVS